LEVIHIKTILKATATIAVFSIATRAAAFVNRIFLSRTIGSEGMGLYQIVCSVFGVLLTITSSGIPIAVSKQTAKLRAQSNFDGGHSTVSAAMVIGVSAALIITLIIVIFKDFTASIFADERCMPLLLVLLPGITASAVYSAYRGGLWGQKNFFAYSLCEFLEEVLLIGLSVILVSGVSNAEMKVHNAATAVSISFIASALIAVCLYFYFDGKFKSPRGYYRPLINSAAPLTGIRAASSVITSLLALIIPLRLKLSGLSVSEALSEFGIASGMTLPLLFIPGTLIGPLALALIPEISEKKDKKSFEVSTQIESALLFSVLVSLAVFPVYIAAGKDIGIALYNNERSGELLMYSAAIMIPMSISHMSSSILNILGMEFKSLKNYLIGAAFMLLSIWFLPSIMGIYSMLLGFFISFSITAFLNTLAIMRNTKRTGILRKNLFKLLLPVAAAFIVCSLTNIVCKMFMPLIFSVVISGTLSLIVFIIICGAMNITGFDRVLKKTPLKILISKL
jgi:stage V sporulation protein B